MTNQELIDAVVKLYDTARKQSPLFDGLPIKRGQIPAIASLTEDLMARFIYDRATLTHPELYVEFPMTYEKEGTSLNQKRKKHWQALRPDIAVIQKADGKTPLMTDVVDVKVDLGYKRVLDDTINKAFTALSDLRELGKVKSYNWDLPVSKDLQWHIVVLSDANSSDPWRAENQRLIQQPQYQGKLHLYIFSDGQHPNEKDCKPNPRHGEINRFVSSIKPLLP